MAYPSVFRSTLTSILRQSHPKMPHIAPHVSLPITTVRSFHASPRVPIDMGNNSNNNNSNSSSRDSSPISSFGDILSKPKFPGQIQRKPMGGTDGGIAEEFDAVFRTFSSNPDAEEHHLHIYSTKHNTHITFTDPKKQPIISVSCGNIGFKKSHRGSYDAAYQLASHVFTKLDDLGVIPKQMEVVLRDFGEGREAVVKALLGTEGRNLKGVITRVTDATRLKFGGTRSKKPRRLG